MKNESIQKNKPGSQNDKPQRYPHHDSIRSTKRRNSQRHQEKRRRNQTRQSISRKNDKHHSPKGTPHISRGNNEPSSSSDVFTNSSPILLLVVRTGVDDGPYARGAPAGQMTGHGVMNFVDKDGDEFHGFEEGGVPEKKVGEEVS